MNPGFGPCRSRLRPAPLSMHEVWEFAGHADIRTTEVYFIREEEDAEVAAPRLGFAVARPDRRISTTKQGLGETPSEKQ